MTEAYANKAYIALFNLLDSKFDKSKDREVGRLLSDMNPNLFFDDTSADSACFEDFFNCCASYTNDKTLNAYNASFLNFIVKSLDLRSRTQLKIFRWKSTAIVFIIAFYKGIMKTMFAK